MEEGIQLGGEGRLKAIRMTCSSINSNRALTAGE